MNKNINCCDWRHCFEKISYLLLETSNIFFTLNATYSNLQQRYPTDDERKKAIKDKIMFRISLYASLQLTIRLDQILEYVIELIKTTEKQNLIVIHYSESEQFIEMWNSLFKPKKSIEHQIKPSKNDYNHLETRVINLREPIKTFRNKVAAHIDCKTDNITLSFESISQVFSEAKNLLKCLYFLLAKEDYNFNAPFGSWGSPENTAKCIEEVITRENEITRVQNSILEPLEDQ